MHCRKHVMASRYGNHDREESFDTKDSSPLDLTPQDHPMPERDNDSSTEYCEETDTCHPLADLLDQFQQLRNQFASNLHAGYHHIPLHEDSIPKTAFTSPFGKYEYQNVTFRLAQALAYFQELMNKVLKDLPFGITYLDNIIIYSKTAEEHLDHLQIVFHKLHDAELTMKLSKCHYFTREIKYLGHVLCPTGIKPLPSKTAAINMMNPSKILKN